MSRSSAPRAHFGLVFSANLAAAASILALHAGAQTAQNIIPADGQSGVNYDGSGQGCGGPIFSLPRNPEEPALTTTTTQLESVWLATGAVTSGQSEVDISLPAIIPWVVARSFNSQHLGSSSGAGYNGEHWFQNSQPELLDDLASDQVKLIYAADRMVNYRLVSGATTVFEGIDGAGGFFEFVEGTEDTTPELNDGTEDLWKLTDMNGLVFTFVGFDDDAGDLKGQLWKVEMADLSASAYVGSGSSLAAARSAGGWSSGRVATAYDSSGRKFTYTYSGSPSRLQSVVATIVNGGNTIEVGRVEYGFYSSYEQHKGDDGDLRTVTVKTPMSDSTVESVRLKYYRYYTDSGLSNHLKLVLDFEGARSFDWSGDATFDADYLSATDAALEPYASAWFEYDGNKKVSLARFNGQCGCSGGGASGTYTFAYTTNGSHPNTANVYDEEWKTRVVVGRPDGSYLTQYFDEQNQALSSVVSEGNPANTPAPTYWPTQVVRDAFGFVAEIWMPDAISAYNHSTGAFTADTSGGLVRRFGRQVSGYDYGYITQSGWFDSAATSTSYVDYANTWNVSTALVTAGGQNFVRPLLGSRRVFDANTVAWDTTTGGNLTSYAYTVYGTQKFAVKKFSETKPNVSTTNNGSGVTHQAHRYYRPDGQLAYASEKPVEVSGAQVIEYRTYNAEGQVTAIYEDADIAGPGSDSDFTSPTGISLFNDSETFDYDPQGRLKSVVKHDGRVERHYWSVLADRRIARVSFPHYTTSSGGSYAVPATYTVMNHASGSEFSATIDATVGDYVAVATTAIIDETDSDPILALGAGATIGALTHVRTNLYDASGSRVLESRTYFLTPSSGAGVDGTNYDPTLYAYDGMGRLIRTKEPHGTIYRSVYDARGLQTQRWIGTNDQGLASGESSGTNNMVQTSAASFDVNGRLTTQTEYTESTTGSGGRTMTRYLDLRGRAIAIVNPTAPHTVSSFDNLGRVTATARYSSSSGLGASSAPTSATNRLAYSETFYDERGQAWKRVRHDITASTGASAESLELLSWYDETGRLVKVDGEQLVKYSYDRLHRRTHEFVLASDNDSTFSDVLNATGDTVLEERQTVYDSNHNVWMNVSIARLYDNVGGSATTGPLDSNADGDPNIVTAANVSGRAQITAYWYDHLSREKARAEYGTNDATANVGTFNRTDFIVSSVDTPPTRSDTVLVTTTIYGKDGQVGQVTDPKDLDTAYEYDGAGRKVAEIANYVDGTAGGGANGDEDQIVRYSYTDGLMVTLTADLPSGETDQVTTYTFGTTKGTSAGQSKIAAMHLLSQVQYPDSTDAVNDIVAFAYNAQGEEIWRRDQALPTATTEYNVIETDYDLAGRVAARRVTKKRDISDGAVLRIETAYDGLGRVDTVTQYNAATSGNIVDQVKNVFDGWGNLRRFRQDHDSAVGAGGGSLPAEEIEYTFEKATTGRNTVRRAGLLLPDGEEFVFAYSTASTSFDNAASRVTAVQDDVGSDLAAYRYNGAGHLVSTHLAEPDVYSSLYGASGSAFGNLDRFNRVSGSKWTKDLSSDVDFFSVTVGYDRNSNVTHQDDLIFGGLDALYVNDNLNRLTRAHEGTLSSGSITSPARDQQWTLNQTGNWNRDKVDLNGDGDFTDAGEVDDTRTHNAANELLTRDTNSSSPAEHSFAYDAAGNMTDDGVHKYEWDAFYRLRKVRNQSNDLICEYWYNGLGFLIIRHQDNDGSGKVESSDKKYHTYYDERWRQIATFREADALPKEQFVYHSAGNGGWGGSSYIDSTLLRDKDQSTAWTAEADRTETRAYYCQNWRADVVVILDDAGAIQESVRYSAYGVPFGVPMGDADADGDCDDDDLALVSGWVNTPTYNIRGDFNLDGLLDDKDETIATDNDGAVHGRGVLSDAVFGNRKGYAGYEGDAKLSAKWHVRHRVLDSVLGRWLARDPLRYIDGMNALSYVIDGPIKWVDSLGLSTTCRPGVSRFVSSMNGWTVFLKIEKSPGDCAVPSPCKFHVLAGVGFFDRNYKVHKFRDDEADTDEHKAWHHRAGQSDDMEVTSETGDVDPEGDSGLNEKGEPEPFGRKSGGGPAVGSQPQAVFAVSCGARPRWVHIRLASPSGYEMPAPPGGVGRAGGQVEIWAWLYLTCGSGNCTGRTHDTVPIPPGGGGGPSSPGSPDGCPGGGPKSGGDTDPSGPGGGGGRSPLSPVGDR